MTVETLCEALERGEPVKLACAAERNRKPS